MSIKREKVVDVTERITYLTYQAEAEGYAKIENGKVVFISIDMLGYDNPVFIAKIDCTNRLRMLTEVSTALLEELEKDEEED